MYDYEQTDELNEGCTEPEGERVLPDPITPQRKTVLNFPAGLILGLVLGICGTGIVCIIALLIMYNSDTLRLNYSSSEKLKLIEQMIHQRYLHEDEVTPEMLEEGMYRGMVDSLGDPYSVYYNEDDLKSLLESSSGSFGGIGVHLTQDPDTGVVTVYKVMDGYPAAKAGVSENDILIRVAGEEIKDMDLSTIVSKVRGEKGTKVLLDLMRDDKEVEVEIVRDIIEYDTVACEMKDEEKGIGYITIDEFDDVTYEQFVNAINELKEKGMKSMILDLRGNPGGNVDTVCDMCDRLMGEGIIVSVEDKNGKKKEYTSDSEQLFKGDIVVLVDGNSASAAEIMTGALKDTKLATVVGTTTFGKGIVQSVYPLGDGTAVKLTVENYYTPSGYSIHGKGIKPDVEIDFDEESYKKDKTDNQLEKALEILRGK